MKDSIARLTAIHTLFMNLFEYLKKTNYYLNEKEVESIYPFLLDKLHVYKEQYLQYLMDMIFILVDCVDFDLVFCSFFFIISSSNPIY